MENLLTVPASTRESRTMFCTGNHYLSLTEIMPNGDITSLSHLSAAFNGLVFYKGTPLLSLRVNKKELSSRQGYAHDFFVRTSGVCDGVDAQQTIFAPDKIRGFVCAVRLLSDSDTDCELVYRLTPDSFSRTVFKTRPLSVVPEYLTDEWTKTACVELMGTGGVSALALSANGEYETGAADGSAYVLKRVALKKGIAQEVFFYVSVGSELDGARLVNVDMRRRGATLYERQKELQRQRHIELPNKKLEESVNLNAAFCRAFSVGYTLDTDRLMLTTSKSDRYYVCGAYWARDCMIWAFPLLLYTDPALARSALLASLTVYLERGAEHALYLNGAPLYPGFELDELAAPVTALERYVEKTGDREILQLPEVKSAMKRISEKFEERRDEATGLYSTELNASDDPVGCPFITYDNALALKALRFIDRLFVAQEGRVERLERAIKEQCVVNGIFAWAVDGKGEYEIYDNPPGSLVLLSYYGAVSRDDEVYKNTVAHYFSEKNPYYTENDLLFGTGCAHSPKPWPMSLCNLLLGTGYNERALEVLAAMPMDGGLACETVWAEDGSASTGSAFATFSGFFAATVIETYENKN